MPSAGSGGWSGRSTTSPTSSGPLSEARGEVAPTAARLTGPCTGTVCWPSRAAGVLRSRTLCPLVARAMRASAARKSRAGFDGRGSMRGASSFGTSRCERLWLFGSSRSSRSGPSKRAPPKRGSKCTFPTGQSRSFVVPPGDQKGHEALVGDHKGSSTIVPAIATHSSGLFPLGRLPRSAAVSSARRPALMRSLSKRTISSLLRASLIRSRNHDDS